jgi:hypothetical protein
MMQDAHAEFALQAGAQTLDGGGVTQSVEHEMAPLLRECARDAEPDSAGGTGDQYSLSLEHEMSLSKKMTAIVSAIDPCKHDGFSRRDGRKPSVPSAVPLQRPQNRMGDA